MLCTRCLQGVAKVGIRPRTVQQSKHTLTAAPRRTFLTRNLLRPSILPSLSTPLSTPGTTTTTTTTSTTATATSLDLLPKISTHPSLAGIQVRNGPRNTYDPSHFVRKRRHGFLARKRSRTGRAILLRRRAKRRGVLSH